MRPDVAQPVRLENYRPTAYAIETVDLDIRLAPHATRVIARMGIAARAETAPGTPLALDGDELALTGLSIDGAALTADAFEVAPDKLVIRNPPSVPFTLEIITELDPESNSKLMGLYRSNSAYCTQCEAEGFRRITYLYDRPDILAVYTTRLEARKSDAPVLLANGNPVSSGDIEGTERHFAIWHDPFPKPAYLFAMVAGDLALVRDTFTTMSGREVDLRIYVEYGNEERCDYAMDALKRSMRWDETAFGCEYDLDIFVIVAVSDFNMGAMENKGLNIFNDKYILANPQIATDQDYAHIESIIAHEYFHNWTGNRITCRDWFQLCLKEGLTVFRDQEFSADQRSAPVKRIADVRLLRSHQFPEDAGPLAHPVRPKIYHQINNFYTATVYEKGAELVRMLHTWLGEDTFRAGMDLYFDRHDGDAATIEDFLACFAEASKTDLTQFSRWYDQAGTPSLRFADDWNEASQTYTLDIEQFCPPTPGESEKLPMTIPVRFGLVGPNGHDLEWQTVSGGEMRGDVVVLTEKSHKLVFTGIGARPVPSLLRGFSAPVNTSHDLPREDLVFLARHDNDTFNRWQAVQTIAMELLTLGAHARVSNGASCRARSLPQAMVADLATLIGEIASDAKLEPAYRALVLQLPGESDIAREIATDVNPDSIAGARKALMGEIARACGETFARLYAEQANGAAYSPDAADAGRRALSAILLDYLAETEPQHSERAARHYHDADNMTDRLAALKVLVHRGDSEANAALGDFYQRYRDNALVLDKWFTVQATAPFAGTLDHVEALTRHPAFSFTNPNRVRALISAFATGNQTQFNRRDGAGYDFLAAFVLELDKRNPQVAARLLSAFRSWRALELERRQKAEAALRRVESASPLSSDVQDIVARSLQ